MKGLATVLAALAVGTLLLTAALVTLLAAAVELLARLVPVLIVIAICWGAWRLWRARHTAPGPDDDQRLLHAWGHPPAQPLPPATTAQERPPLRPHPDRTYPILGQDNGFASPRQDGYLNASAPLTPPETPNRASRPVGMPGRRSSHRRARNPRSSRP